MDRRVPYPLRGEWAITSAGRDKVIDVWEAAHATGKADRLLAALEDRDGVPLDNARAFEIDRKVAKIPVEGPLFRKAEMLSAVSGATSYEWIGKQVAAVREAHAKGDVDSAVLVFNTPGGEAAGMLACSDLIRSLADSMEVVAYVETQASSAGWCLAAQCGRIVAHRSAYVGSIGVRRMLTDTAEAEKKLGIVNHEIIATGGEDKRSTPVDEKVIERAQKNADELMVQFVASVASGRGVDPETVLSDYGKGDELIATRALSVGMIDELGSLEDVMQRLGADGAEVQSQAAPSGAIRPGKGASAMSRQTAAVGTPKAAADPEKKDEKADAKDGDPKAEAEPEMEKCMKCGGSGKNADGAECKHCEGEGEIEKKAEDDKEPARAEKADDDGDNDGDERKEGKKALAALSGLRLSASVAAHSAAIESKLVPRTALANLEKQVAAMVTEKAAEKKAAEDAKCEAFADRAEQLGAFAGLDKKAAAEKRAKYVTIARTNPADIAEEILASLPAARVQGRQTAGGHPVDGKHSAQPKIDVFSDSNVRRVSKGDVDVLEAGSPDLMTKAQQYAVANKVSIEEGMVAVVKAEPGLMR